MESLSVEAVAAFATSRFGGSDVERLPSGTWSQAFALTVGAERLVLRIGGFLADYEVDRVAGGWARPGLPVPRVLELGRAFDRWYVLTRRVFGTPLDSLSEAGWGGAVSSLAEMLAALQSVESPSGDAGTLAAPTCPSGTTWHEWLLESAVDLTDPRLGHWRDAMNAHGGVVDRYDDAVADLGLIVGECPELPAAAHGRSRHHGLNER